MVAVGGKIVYIYGPDQLILLLNSVDKEIGAQILLLLWRVWHLRNDVIHGNGTYTILGSANFLTSCSKSLRCTNTRQQSRQEEKGKMKVGTEPGNGMGNLEDAMEVRKIGKRWKSPPSGWVKVNTDTSFCHGSGEASASIVIRDTGENVLLSA
jgi:hypothetical protein